MVRGEGLSFFNGEAKSSRSSIGRLHGGPGCGRWTQVRSSLEHGGGRITLPRSVNDPTNKSWVSKAEDGQEVTGEHVGPSSSRPVLTSKEGRREKGVEAGVAVAAQNYMIGRSS